MRATTNHDHGGTAINVIAYLDHDDALIVGPLLDGSVLVGRPYDGDERRVALERVRAAIDAELGDRADDAGQPDYAPVIAALARHALRSGDVAVGDHAVLWEWLHAARDWGD